MTNVFTVAGLLIKETFRKKDFYVTFVFTGLVLLFAARMSFYNVGNTYRYLLDIGLGLGVFFAALLATSLSARQYPSEIQNRTCHVLLSKPVSRVEFLVGKFLGSFAAGCVSLALFFAVILFSALSKTHEISMVSAGQCFYLFCLSLMVLTALSVFFSIFMTTAGNVSIVLALYFLISVYGFTIHQSALAASPIRRLILETLNFAIPHFGFFDARQRFIHGWPVISPQLMFFLTAYAFFYSALFLLFGWFLFRRKNIL